MAWPPPCWSPGRSIRDPAGAGRRTGGRGRWSAAAAQRAGRAGRARPGSRRSTRPATRSVPRTSGAPMGVCSSMRRSRDQGPGLDHALAVRRSDAATGCSTTRSTGPRRITTQLGAEVVSVDPGRARCTSPVSEPEPDRRSRHRGRRAPLRRPGVCGEFDTVVRDTGATYVWATIVEDCDHGTPWRVLDEARPLSAAPLSVTAPRTSTRRRTHLRWPLPPRPSRPAGAARPLWAAGVARWRRHCSAPWRRTTTCSSTGRPRGRQALVARRTRCCSATPPMPCRRRSGRAPTLLCSTPPSSPTSCSQKDTIDDAVRRGTSNDAGAAVRKVQDTADRVAGAELRLLAPCALLPSISMMRLIAARSRPVAARPGPAGAAGGPGPAARGGDGARRGHARRA